MILIDTSFVVLQADQCLNLHRANSLRAHVSIVMFCYCLTVFILLFRYIK